ncbi:SGNH/GDSL hydrolase family protein [Micromonospora carbonacea]|uniref:SGNH/GDSL hydrolase family protein n=1 Tax=Micromonospora carbonacea TaxID=47853 RepID=A0A7H8XIM4_9ACTN|nr:SGNH/GDSL hydrolase family protein [Micromonospora carbonacea]MBB5827811.1 lysophospholipase L1-like esterase [Micromonospora carbonacea]QLD24480.1 SGNH/GDSL hydrolase family protein [Micromonospora carbonacea]
MLLGAGQRVVFIGDSITDCGRRDHAAPYGDGYLSLVRAFVDARYPERELTWVNRGVGGDTIRDLAARWDADAIAERPDWLCVMVGINDIWRAFSPGQEAEAVPIDEYERTLRALLRRAVTATGCRLVLADPFLIEADVDEPQRAETDRYAAVVAAVAKDFEAVHVATQAAFDRVLAHSPSSRWADDRVHPGLPGHAVIADAFLAAFDA